MSLAPAGPFEPMPPDIDTSWVVPPGWVDARGDGAPLWLRDATNRFWFEYLSDTRTVYVEYAQVADKENETVEAFAERLFAFVADHPVDRFVLDLRRNRGGNGALNRPILLGIIRSKVDRPGHLFTIVGRSTWSAAQMLVNDLEKYTHTVFVGEPTGGKVNHYGDSRKITLPNSGITVRVSTLWWQDDERDTRPWTAPALAADLTFEDYRANRDPAMRAILGYVPARPLGEILREAVSTPDEAAAAGAFRRWKAEPRNAYADPEPELIDLGYRLMSEGRAPEAIRIFRIAVEAFPDSANAHDSLGEAYMKSGDRDSAIRSYERALALDPRMNSARDALATLRGPGPAIRE